MADDNANLDGLDRIDLTGYPALDRAIMIIYRSLFKILKYLLGVVLLLCFSFLGYRWVRNAYYPKYILYEPVYFDYSMPQPQANISLWALEKQWYYINGRYPNTISKDERFNEGAKYQFLLDFRLAYSPRNVDTGHFMAFLSVFDSNNEAIAKSARPVVIPYKSFITSTLDTLVNYPLRFIPFRRTPSIDVVDVHIEFMNEYVEPSKKNEPYTSLIEVQLSSNTIDIEHVQLSIMPHMSWLQSLLYYYPIISFFLISGFFFWSILIVVISTVIAYYLFQLINAEEPAAENDDDIVNNNNDANNNNINNNDDNNNVDNNNVNGNDNINNNDDNSDLDSSSIGSVNISNSGTDSSRNANLNYNNSNSDRNERELSDNESEASEMHPDISSDPNLRSLLLGDHSGLMVSNSGNSNSNSNSSGNSSSSSAEVIGSFNDEIDDSSIINNSSNSDSNSDSNSNSNSNSNNSGLESELRRRRISNTD